jgi:hypothetical protein
MELRTPQFQLAWRTFCRRAVVCELKWRRHRVTSDTEKLGSAAAPNFGPIRNASRLQATNSETVYGHNHIARKLKKQLLSIEVNGTYIYHYFKSWSPLWSSIVPGYRSRGPGFYSQRYQIFWEVVGLERGPLSLVTTTEELLDRKVEAPV